MKPALPSKLDPSAAVADQAILYRRTHLPTARHCVCTKCLRTGRLVMAGLGASRGDPSHTCIVGGARKECALSTRPCCARCVCVAGRTAMVLLLQVCYCAIDRVHQPAQSLCRSSLRSICSSSREMMIHNSCKKQARRRPYSTFSCGSARCCCVTRHTLSGSHLTQRACTAASLRRQRGRPLKPFGMVLPWQVLACAYEAVRGTEKKQVRSPTPV